MSAYLWKAPAAKIAETIDIPWCRADLYHPMKLVAAVQAAEGATWVPVE